MIENDNNKKEMIIDFLYVSLFFIILFGLIYFICS